LGFFPSFPVTARHSCNGKIGERIRLRFGPRWRGISAALPALLNLTTRQLGLTAGFFRSRREQAIVELALRQPPTP